MIFSLIFGLFGLYSRLISSLSQCTASLCARELCLFLSVLHNARKSHFYFNHTTKLFTRCTKSTRARQWHAHNKCQEIGHHFDLFAVIVCCALSVIHFCLLHSMNIETKLFLWSQISRFVPSAPMQFSIISHTAPARAVGESTNGEKKCRIKKKTAAGKSRPRTRNDEL